MTETGYAAIIVSRPYNFWGRRQTHSGQHEVAMIGRRIDMHEIKLFPAQKTAQGKYLLHQHRRARSKSHVKDVNAGKIMSITKQAALCRRAQP
jgi:hypothetical protein